MNVAAEMQALRKRVAVVQSNYIPWKGYFDLINYVDEFILYDEVQFTRRDWRNRNLIKTPKGLEWITVPVEVKGNYHAAICDIRIADPQWGRRHWATLAHNYARAPFFRQYKDLLEPAFVDARETHLSQLNRRLIELLCGFLGIRTRLSWSSDYSSGGDRNERLLGLCKAVGAGLYLSGPAAKGYLDEHLFATEGVAVEWMDYSGYPEYPQLYGSFEHTVTVIDLLLNTGAEASRYMKSFGWTRPEAAAEAKE